MRYEAAKRIEVEHDAELEERQRLQQERMERAGKVNAVEDGGTGGSSNKSGEWKHSASGLEWVVMEEDEEERIEREIAADSDSDLDVEVVQNSQQDEEENFTKGKRSKAIQSVSRKLYCRLEVKGHKSMR